MITHGLHMGWGERRQGGRARFYAQQPAMAGVLWGLLSHQIKPTFKTLMLIKNRLVVAKEEEEGSGMDGEPRVSRCKLLHLEWISMEFPSWRSGERIRLGTMRLRVRSLASLGGLRIWCCRELWCRSQMPLGSCVAVAVA